MKTEKHEGLAGVNVGETAICSVKEAGNGLAYRGYSIEDLANHATFEEVAYLLIWGKLPNHKELTHFQQNLIRAQALPAAICLILEQLPKNANPMDVLRTAVSALGCLEFETSDYTQKKIAERLLPFSVSALMYWYHYQLTGKKINVYSQQPTIAGHFLFLLTGAVPKPEHQRALDVSLILYAEHEFNASTFSARVTVSTGTDFYSPIVSAIATLRGPLHGGANEAAMNLIAGFKDSLAAEQGIRELLEKHALIMGFGHRVYKEFDPRSAFVKKMAQELAELSKDEMKFVVAEKIEEIMMQDKHLFPNVDFYSALVYYYIGIPTPLFTPLFAISRMSGWSAHIMEQRAHNRLIRPGATYIGPAPITYIDLKDRV